MKQSIIKEIELNDKGEIIAMKGILRCKKPIRMIDDLIYYQMLEELGIKRML